jgi:hypothetical protein
VAVLVESDGADVRSAVELTEIRSALDLIDILDLDDEDPEAGFPDERERPN